VPTSIANASRFPSSMIRQQPKPTPVVQRVGHEVERPRLIQDRRRDKRLAQSLRYVSLLRRGTRNRWQ
jgi:hypothetical protein